MTDCYPSDKDLVKKLIQNNEDAFQELYIRYKQKIWNYCFSFLKNEEEAHDFTQEIFLQIWEMRIFIDPGLSLSSFLYTIARNRVISYFRHMDITLEYEKNMALRPEPALCETEENIDLSEYLKILESAVDKLPDQRKKIFKLSRFEHLSHKQIAAELGISIYTVQEHISAALVFIKAYFAENSDLTLSLSTLMALFWHIYKK